YQEMLATMGGLDIDDLLMRVALTLMNDTGLRDDLEDRYRYVLIDEYQDTNAAQYTIARLLTRENENIAATGDPDQSIYGWRGADIRNIRSFERYYPRAKVVRLEQNYRSTKRILAAADRLIARNSQRKEKRLWTSNHEGAPLRVIECEDGDDEALVIAKSVVTQLKSGISPDDIAVFYRINSLSRGIEEAFLRAGVRYQVARGVEFYNRKEVKDVLAYLRVLINPSDEVSLLRIINTPTRGIGETTCARLVQLARSTGRAACDLLTSDVELATLGRSHGKVEEFRNLLRGFAGVIELPAPRALEHVISHSGLRAFYKPVGEADDSPCANLDELVSAAAAYQQEHPEATIVDWLEHAALVSDVDSVVDDPGRVTLMTLHAAKGLEFPVVYIIGVEEALLPLSGRDGDETDWEEERRLCFVGMTRAKEQLTLSHARYRMIRGVTQRTNPSRFLDELADDQVEWVQGPTKAREPASAVCRGRLPDDIAEWKAGILVRHPLRGLGRVLSFHRGARRTHVSVEFKDGSRQSWVLEFAQLERVDYDDIG
ncbi:MAG: ATP-dependent helicase, partial [Phycisphaerae bacterium]